MAHIQSGSSASGLANVDSNYNLQVRTPTTESQAGFAQMSSEIDAGTLTGSRLVKAPEASPDYRFRVGIDQSIFNSSFEGTVVPQALLSQVVSTYAIAQASGFLTLNSGSSVAAGHAVIRTYRTFPLFGSYPTYAEFWVVEANETATNAITEFGLGYATTTAAATDGVFFRRVGAGQLRGVVNFAGVEVTSDLTSGSAGNRHHYLIVVHNDEVQFWIDNVLAARVATPVGQGGPTQASALPVFARVYSGSATSAARRLSIGFVNISIGDMFTGKPWSHAISGGGGGSYQIQQGTASGGTVSRAAATNGWPASTTAKTSGTWTATSAPASNDLGGRWLTPAISSLTSDADYPVFSYLNPAGTNALPGKTLYVTGVRVGETIATAAASTNGILLCYALGVGSTASATTATEGAAVIAARIVPLGQCYFLATAAIGESKAGFEVKFDSPLVVPSGTYFQFIVRPVGTVTSNTLVVTGMLSVNGYFV